MYKAQGKYDQAESLFKRALAICEKGLGLDHPTTRNVRTSLAAMQAERVKKQAGR